MTTAESDLHEATVEWVKKTIERRYPHATALAAAAGVTQSSLSRLFREPTYQLSAATLRNIAAISDAPIPQVIKNLLDRSPAKVQKQKVNIGVSRAGIPIWGCHPARQPGEYWFNPASLHEIPRPPQLAGSDRIICFYAPDDTMAPRWMAGEPVLVDVKRAATGGDFVLALVKAPETDADAQETGVFRKLDGRSGGRIHLSALAEDVPPMSFPLDRLVEVRRVLKWDDIIR